MPRRLEHPALTFREEVVDEAGVAWEIHDCKAPSARALMAEEIRPAMFWYWATRDGGQVVCVRRDGD